MTFDELAALPEAGDGKCFFCKVLVTDKNRSMAQQVHEGKLYDLCQNCYRRDDVAELDSLLRGRQ